MLGKTRGTAKSGNVLRATCFVNIVWSVLTNSRSTEHGTRFIYVQISEDVGRQLRQLRPLALLQLNMRRNRFRAETAHDVIETVRRRIHVRIINLVGIAGENDFRSVADARD